MRHRVKKRKLGRLSAHRQALLRNLLQALFLHGHVTTTHGKAKEVKRWADKLIHQAQDNSVHSRRQLHKFFGKNAVVNTLVDKVAPAFTDRKSGFTTLTKVGRRRGDNSVLYRLELVKQPADLGSFKNQQKKK